MKIRLALASAFAAGTLALTGCSKAEPDIKEGLAIEFLPSSANLSEDEISFLKIYAEEAIARPSRNLYIDILSGTCAHDKEAKENVNLHDFLGIESIDEMLGNDLTHDQAYIIARAQSIRSTLINLGVRENQIIIDELNPAAPSRCNRADEPYFTDQYGRELDGRVGVVSFNRGIDHD